MFCFITKFKRIFTICWFKYRANDFNSWQWQYWAI